jgi:hypothetical protein
MALLTAPLDLLQTLPGGVILLATFPVTFAAFSFRKG